MTKLFENAFSSAERTLGSGGVFIICAALLTAAFVAAALLSIFKRSYSFKKRLWFLPLSLGIVLLEVGVENFFNSQNGFSIFTAALAAVDISVLYVLPERKNAVTEKQRTLARFLDDCAKNSLRGEKNEEDVKAQAASLRTERILPSAAEKENVEKELDFSHVKSVIKRLDYYGLSQNDKRQVKDLEASLSFAEREGMTPIVKSKINDGLGALLKIMSKYGV